jgi:hypothetical protein
MILSMLIRRVPSCIRASGIYYANSTCLFSIIRCEYLVALRDLERLSASL